MRIMATMFQDGTLPAEDTGFEMLPLGQHLFEVTEAEAKSKESPAGAVWTIWLKARIIQSEDPAAVGKTGLAFWKVPSGREEKDYWPRLWRRVQAVAPRAVEKTGIETDFLVGLTFKAAVTSSISEKDGRKRHDISFPYPTGMAEIVMPVAPGAEALGPVGAPPDVCS